MSTAYHPTPLVVYLCLFLNETHVPAYYLLTLAQMSPDSQDGHFRLLSLRSRSNRFTCNILAFTLLETIITLPRHLLTYSINLPVENITDRTCSVLLRYSGCQIGQRTAFRLAIFLAAVSVLQATVRKCSLEAHCARCRERRHDRHMCLHALIVNYGFLAFFAPPYSNSFFVSVLQDTSSNPKE
jgi:uncharacterized membrane protein